MAKDIRWIQRFDNLSKSHEALVNSLKLSDVSELERAGIIQYFEMTFELCWKTLKDYLNEQGYRVRGPKEVLRQAFQSELLSDGHVWLQALEDRNSTTHLYDEKAARAVEARIRDVYILHMNRLLELLDEHTSR